MQHSTTHLPSVKSAPVQRVTPGDPASAAAVLPGGQWAPRQRQPEVHAPCPRCREAQSLITAAAFDFAWAWCRACYLSAPCDTVRDGTWQAVAETRPPRTPETDPDPVPPRAERGPPPLTPTQLRSLRASALLRLWLRLHAPDAAALTRSQLAAAAGTDARRLRRLLVQAAALGLVVRQADRHVTLAARLPDGLHAETLRPLSGERQRALLALALGPVDSQRALQRATGLSHDRLRTTYHWLCTATQGAENTQGGAKNTHPALAGARPFLFSPRSDSDSENREVGMQHARAERIARAREETASPVAPTQGDPDPLVQRLTECGLRPAAARRLLVAMGPAAVQRQLDFWPQYQALYAAAGQTIRDSAAFLAAAVRRGYVPQPPPAPSPAPPAEPPLDPEAQAAAARLTALGVRPNVSRRLAQQYPESTRTQLDCWPRRRGIRRPAAFLVAAIRYDYAPPWSPPADPAPTPSAPRSPTPDTDAPRAEAPAPRPAPAAPPAEPPTPAPAPAPDPAWVQPDPAPPWPQALARTPAQERRWMQARAAAEAESQRPDPPDEPDRGAAFGLAAFRLRRIVQPIAWQADVVTLAANVPAEHARVRRGLLGRCIEEALAAADLQVRWYEAPAVSLQGPVPPAEAWDYLQEDTEAAAAVTRWRFDVKARTLCVALEEAAAAAPLERALQALLGPTWTLRVQHARPGWWLQPAPAWTDVQAWLLRQSASARGLALLSQLQPVAWQPAAARAAFRLPAALP